MTADVFHNDIRFLTGQHSLLFKTVYDITSFIFLMFLVSFCQEGDACFTKSDGLKRGFQSIDSSDYQMGEISSGKSLSLVNLDQLEEWCS